MTDSLRIQKIIEKLEVPTKRSPTVDQEVAEILQSPGFDDDVLDQTHLAYVTIDNTDSRDLDQAIFVEKPDQEWIVYYALADASYYVKPGTALFEDAIKRGTSYYFPTFAIPMLPEALSEGLVSLNADVVRRALVFKMTVTNQGQCLATEIVRAKIRSRAKLSYSGVQRFFDDGAKTDHAWAPSMRAFRAVGEVLVDASVRRGVIQYDRAEADISVQGDRFVLQRRERNDVERWNEQISLLTNTEGARILNECGRSVDDLQSVYRVHLPPMAHRLKALKKLVDQVCDRHSLDDQYRWDGEVSLAAYLSGLPAEPAHIAQALQRQVQYSNRASEYSDRVGPHFALAVDQYARFSSPMREIVGIFTHKEALEGLDFEDPTESDDDSIRARVIDAGNDAKRVQKKIDNEVKLLAIGDLLDRDLTSDDPPARTGTVIGVRPTRVYVLLDDLPLDMKVYVKDLELQFETTFAFEDSLIRSKSGELTIGLGDRLALQTVRYDSDRRHYIFSVERL